MLGRVLLGLSLVGSPTMTAAKGSESVRPTRAHGPSLSTRTANDPPPVAAGSAAARPARPPLPARARVRRSAALLALSLPLLATGSALVVLRTRSFDRQVGSCAIGPTEPLCSEPAIVAHAHYAAAGAGLVGSGLGLIAAGVTAAVPVRRRVWLAQAIVGGVTLTLGAAWLAAESAAYPRSDADDYATRVGPWFDRRAVAASLLGAGLGLALGAGVGLLPPSRGARRPASRPTLSPLGFGVVGHF
ncbi:hypothetical protein SAMN02745121_00732 [Nannocystis exedens]|uniref:Uncharacterized protein n=1 Tax=Nannocystis exedens TaxID=54 RepID=A0A1I1TIB9_9BACT|nr:hypothetical protein [Nannocystis exedens]PCC66539.1 hypothetical protein NAEX_09127 [Nannocystis exedens]SFD58354.1 hypothetical protein SAMN02745121_00732 [Nannocystis exedens]